MLRRHEHIPFSIYERLSGPFFLKFSCNGKTDRCALLGCNNDRLFPVKDHISST